MSGEVAGVIAIDSMHNGLNVFTCVLCVAWIVLYILSVVAVRPTDDTSLR